jgi:predicted transcriptional regulator
MPAPRLTKLELRIMEALWARGASSVREIQEQFPAPARPAYTTVQTTVYRLERKQAVRIAKRISNANIFEPAISRDQARGNLIDELLALLGGRGQPVMAHLIDTGKLTLDDIKEAEKTLRALTPKVTKARK